LESFDFPHAVNDKRVDFPMGLEEFAG